MINLEYLQGLGDESRLRPNLFMIPLPALLDARRLNAPYEAEITSVESQESIYALADPEDVILVGGQ